MLSQGAAKLSLRLGRATINPKRFTYLVKSRYTKTNQGAFLEIGFKDKDLRELCEKKAVATKRLGDICARKLHSRLADLRAASRVTELVAGRPHPLKGDRLGQFALDLFGGARLVFEPANDPIPRRDDASIDWSAVSIVCIEFIGDYHD